MKSQKSKAAARTRQKVPKLNAFQKVYENVLAGGAVLLTIYHFLLTILRHLIGRENNFLVNNSGIKAMDANVQVMKTLVKVDFWAAVVLLSASLLYILITVVHFPRSRARLKTPLRRMCTLDGLILLGLALWYIVCFSASGYNTDSFFKRGYFFYELDICICAMLFFPLGTFLGKARIKLALDIIFNAIMAFTTVFISIALVKLFSGEEWVLPNFLKVHMTSKDNTLYIGVNENIGAAIGLTMILIALYMMVSHKGVARWIYLGVYGVALIPHLTAVLLTVSNACYLALLAVFPATAFMAVWTGFQQQLKPLHRILIGLAAAALAVMALVLARNFLVNYFDPQNASSAARQRKFHDTGRRVVWPASLALMVESPRNFFLGTPRFEIASSIARKLKELFGITKTYAHAHNQILQVGVAMGVPAMLAYVAYLVRTLIRCIKVLLRKAGADVPGAWFLPIAVGGMVINSVFEPFLLTYVSAIACLFYLFAGYIRTIDQEDVGITAEKISPVIH